MAGASSEGSHRNRGFGSDERRHCRRLNGRRRTPSVVRFVLLYTVLIVRSIYMLHVSTNPLESIKYFQNAQKIRVNCVFCCTILKQVMLNINVNNIQLNLDSSNSFSSNYWLRRGKLAVPPKYCLGIFLKTAEFQIRRGLIFVTISIFQVGNPSGSSRSRESNRRRFTSITDSGIGETDYFRSNIPLSTLRKNFHPSA